MAGRLPPIMFAWEMFSVRLSAAIECIIYSQRTPRIKAELHPLGHSSMSFFAKFTDYSFLARIYLAISATLPKSQPSEK